MKKLLLATMIAVAGISATVPAQAQHYNGHRGGHHHHHGGYRGGWVAPLIGGAIIGGVIANQYYRSAPPPPVYVYPQEPVYVNPPVYGTTVCRPVQAIDQFGYRYWTQECYEQR